MATRRYGAFLQCVLVEYKRLLAIEAAHKVLHIRGVDLRLLLRSNERHIASPARFAYFPSEGIHIGLSQLNFVGPQCQCQFIAVGQFVETAQDVDIGTCGFNILLLKESSKAFLTDAHLLAVLTTQDGLNLSARLSRSGKIEPFGLHLLLAGGENLHLVAALEAVAQRHELMVDLHRKAVGAKEGVDMESEVESRGVVGHGLDFTFRREDEDFFREEVELDGVEQIKRVGLWVVEDFFDGVEPFVEFILVVVGILILVFPMCRKALLGNIVHAVGTDLHFNPFTLGRHKRVVESLIAIGLGR